MFAIEIKDGNWRRVRHLEPMTEDEALDLIFILAKWNLGLFRIVPC